MNDPMSGESFSVEPAQIGAAEEEARSAADFAVLTERERLRFLLHALDEAMDDLGYRVYTPGEVRGLVRAASTRIACNADPAQHGT